MSLRTTFTRPTIDLADRKFVEGTEEQRRQAQKEAAEQIRLHQQHELAMKSGLREVRRADVEWRRFGQVEVAGEFFHVIRGQVSDPSRSSAVAWFVDAANEIVWLERPASGPRNRAELEQREAERERRRNAPKPKSSWMNP